MHGQFIIGSPLSFDVNPMEHGTKIKSDIVSAWKPLCTEHEYQALPRFFIDEKLAIVPKNWKLNSREKKFTWTVLILQMKNPSYCDMTPLG